MGWFPLVTMWQVLLDLPGAGSIPIGYGHLYSATANLESWVGRDGPARLDAREDGRPRVRAREAALQGHVILVPAGLEPGAGPGPRRDASGRYADVRARPMRGSAASSEKTR